MQQKELFHFYGVLGVHPGHPFDIVQKLDAFSFEASLGILGCVFIHNKNVQAVASFVHSVLFALGMTRNHNYDLLNDTTHTDASETLDSRALLYAFFE